MNNNETKMEVSTTATLNNLMSSEEFQPNISLGTISFDFELYKKTVDSICDSYKVVVYSENADESIKQMREDRAKLNKLAEKLDEKRKSIKNQFNVPLNTFEQQIKQLITAIKDTNAVIDSSVKKLEEEKREVKRKAIRAYFDSLKNLLPDDYAEEFYRLIYDNKWENSNASQKSFKDAISFKIQTYCDGMSILESDPNKLFLDETIAEFKQTLDLQRCMKKLTDLRRQHAEAIAAEQARLEQEAMAKAAKAIAEREQAIRKEERAKVEAEQVAASIPIQTIACNTRCENPTQNLVIDNTEQLNLSASDETPISNDIPSDTVYVRVVGGMIIEAFSNIPIKLVVCDEDIASQQEIIDFGIKTKGLNKIII